MNNAFWEAPVTGKTRRHVAALALPLALILTACGGQNTSSTDGLAGQVLVDGSSTVSPLTSAAGELFKGINPNVNVSVATSGTGGGFKKFCAGETDIANASREISEEEAAECEANGIDFTEIIVANDALTIVVNTENTWADCLTLPELRTMWSPDSTDKITNWNQIRSGFPDVPLDLYGAGTDSGTFDYFTEEVMGAKGASRTDYQPTEDDNVTVMGVQGSKGGLGYFGFSYFEENEGALRAVPIDGGNGCVAPSSAAVQDSTYKPLARPLFIYVNNASFASKPQVAAFVDFFINNDAEIAEEALFIPLSPQQRDDAQAALTRLQG
jgi:phosphate binding protein